VVPDLADVAMDHQPGELLASDQKDLFPVRLAA